MIEGHILADLEKRLTMPMDSDGGDYARDDEEAQKALKKTLLCECLSFRKGAGS